MNVTTDSEYLEISLQRMGLIDMRRIIRSILYITVGLMGGVSGGEIYAVFKGVVSSILLKDLLIQLIRMHLIFLLPVLVIDLVLNYKKNLPKFTIIMTIWGAGLFLGGIIEPIIHKIIHQILRDGL